MFCPRANFCERIWFSDKNLPFVVWRILSLDYKHGFGGQFGVQSDRVDKSAVGWEHHEKVDKHVSQKGREVPSCMMFIYFYYYHKKCLSSTKCIGAPPFHKYSWRPHPLNLYLKVNGGKCFSVGLENDFFGVTWVLNALKINFLKEMCSHRKMTESCVSPELIS